MTEMDALREKAYKFLRWTEKYTKTDMVYAASGGFWLFLGQASTALLSLILAVAFANLLEPEKYGNYKYVLTVAGIIGALTLSGIGNAITRSVAKGRDGTLKHGFRLSIAWSVGMVLLSALAGAYYILRENSLLGISLLFIGAFSPVISAAALYRPFLIGKKDFKRAGLYSILQSGVPAVTSVVALLMESPLLLLLAIYFLSNAITLFLLYKWTEKLTKNEDTDPDLGILGKHISVMNIISTIASKIDSVLVFQLLGGAELAIFTFVTAIPDTVRGSLKSIASLATPKFAEKTRAEIEKTIGNKRLTIAIVTIFIASAYILSAPFIFQYFFPAYIAAVPLSQVYGVVIILNAFLATSFLDSEVLIKEKYFLNIIVNTSTVIFAVGGIIFFGIWGAVAGRIGARIVSVIAAWLVVARTLKKH